MSNRLLIIGAGGHAKVCADTALTMGEFETVAFLSPDADKSPSFFGLKSYQGSLPDPDQFSPTDWQLFIGIGDNHLRAKLHNSGNQGGYLFATLIHPSACISPSTSIAEGTLVAMGAMIQPDCSLGKGVIINTRSGIDHDCTIADFASISPGVTIAGQVAIGQSSTIGTGANVLPGINIGSDVIVGAGACVTKSLVKRGVYTGVPAKRVNSK